MDDRTVPGVASRSDRIRQARATAVGLVLAYGGFSLIKLTDTVFCTRSDEVARCSWAFVTVVPLGFAAAIASTFVMARISSRPMWGARGAAGVGMLIASVVFTQTVTAHLRPEIFGLYPLPPFPSVAAFVAGFGLAAAVTLHAPDPGLIGTRVVTTFSFSMFPAMLGYLVVGENSVLVAAIALAGAAVGLMLRPVDRGGRGRRHAVGSGP